MLDGVIVDEGVKVTVIVGDNVIEGESVIVGDNVFD